MAFLDLCNAPLMKALQDVFGTTIVRVPEERVRPLTVVTSDGRRSFFRGELAPLLSMLPLSSFPCPPRKWLTYQVNGRGKPASIWACKF